MPILLPQQSVEKHFYPDPLRIIVSVFISPACWLHEWLETENGEATVLNDFS